MTRSSSIKSAWQKKLGEIPGEFWTIRDIELHTGLQETAIYRRVEKGIFPKPHKQQVGIARINLWRKRTVLRALDRQDEVMRGLLDTHELAKLLGIGMSRVYQISSKGELPRPDKVVMGRPYWVREKAERFAAARRSRICSTSPGGKKRQASTALPHDVFERLVEKARELEISVSYCMALAVQDFLQKENA